jgi:macrolide transport system ATP-binding/permease protein
MSLEILRLHDIRKYYGPKLILNGVELSLNRGERMALVGENGVGKTTLSRIILGTEPADSGTIRLLDNAEVGYLPQEVTGDDETTVQRYIEQATGALASLREQMQSLEKRMTETLSDVEMAAVLDEYGKVQEQFERRGGYDIEARIERIFAGLSIDYIDPSRPLHTLSGGERTRVALTGLLLRAPDLLILDEPTNHLDFAGIEWLEQYLAAEYANALILITHDRTFINRVANVISELSAVTRVLHTYHGNYDDYLHQREREYEEKVEAYNSQKNQKKSLQRFITTQTHNTGGTISYHDEPDKFIRFFKRMQGDTTKSKKIRDAKVQLERLQDDMMDNPRHEWHIEFRFDPQPLPSAEPIRLQNVSKAFGETVVLNRVDATVRNGERVVLVAPNGTGKTTLLRIIMGYETADSGTIILTPSVRVGFLDQDGETLNPNQTVLDCIREVAQGSDAELLTELHRSGLFSDATLGSKRIADLSVGQRRKLGLARIIGSRANVLLLDEPTNHLDPLSLEALEAALMDFQGAILAVSHDRRFVEKVATRIWRIEHGHLIEELVSER